MPAADEAGHAAAGNVDKAGDAGVAGDADVADEVASKRLRAENRGVGLAASWQWRWSTAATFNAALNTVNRNGRK